jgi:stage III sporulation protein AF
MALVTGLCRSLMPEGPPRRVGGLVCGLLLFTVLVAPVKRVRLDGLGDALTDWASQYEGYSSALEETDRSLERSLIEEQCGAYLEDKARALGCTCTAAVECEEREGLSVPAAVTISGELTREQQEALRSVAVTELALEEEQVHFAEGRSP